ncbi:MULTISPECIES: transporter substrate-binding domain-containing protein [unclassified Microcoleus]|uniref:transporter substrate-binding domain-containing protein n=1 Tax=unclassified Microcoleus TaxID=2642155 RepID=UPI002FD2AFE9
MTDTQGSAILTGSITAPSLTVDSSKSPSAYKFSGKVSGQEVTFEYQKGQELKVAYTGDISLADLLKTVGVTDTQGSAILTGSITAPSLTVDSSKSPSAYKFSGKVSGQEVTFEYQKGQELKVAYTGDISLADLLKKVGITVESNVAILNKSISDASLTISNQSGKSTSYKLTGKITENPIDLEFSKQQIKITYQGETSLVDIVKGVPGVETIATALSVPISNPSFGIGQLDTSNKTFEISGIANFNKGDTGIAAFIDKKLGIQQLNLITKVDSNGASLKGKFETDILLFGDKNSPTDFSATLTGAALGLAVDKKAKPSFGIEGNILLKNYDPVQKNEPPLTLFGGLNLDPKSLTASFEVGSDTPWKNPFGLQNSELRNLSFQLGGSYVFPYIDNVGLSADLKLGGLDVKSAVFIAPKEPDKFGMELTVYQPIGLVDILSVPLSVAGVDNSGFVGKTKKFLKDVLDVTIVSIDGPDEDLLIDPLIKFVPVTTTFGKTTLTQGIALNGKVNAWGKEATLNFAANPFSSDPSLSGSLKIPEINLGFLKITGGNDSTLDVDLKLNSKEQSLKADAGLELFGKKVANFDLSFSPKEISLKNFQLGWPGVLEIKLDNFTLNPSNLSGSASGGIKLFGQDLASASFSLNNGNLSISGKLGISVAGYNFGIDVGFTLGDENRIRMDVDFLKTRYNIVDLSLDPFVAQFKDISSLGTKIKDELFGAVGDVVGYAKDLLKDGLAGVSKVGSYVVDAASDLYKSAESFVSGLFTSKSVKFIGGDGNEEIDGNDNNDVLFGNGGDDTLAGRLRSDVIDGGSGNDQLYGGNDPDTISGGDGNDWIYGQGHSDKLYGGPGDDYIDGEGDPKQKDFGNDEIHGGLGNDTAYGGNNNDRIFGDGGNDKLDGELGEDYLEGDAGDDRINGSGGKDTLIGGTDNDTLIGGTEDDRLEGEQGNDSLQGEDGNDTLEGGTGSDLLFGGQGRDKMSGQEDNDTLIGGGEDDLVEGNGGNDSLIGDGGNDTLRGQQGNDRLDAGTGNDLLYGDDGNDTLRGQQQNDQLRGGFGNDLLFGGDENDTLYGEQDNDTLSGGNGSNHLDGGEGSDWADYSFDNDGITANLSQKTVISRPRVVQKYTSDFLDQLRRDGLEILELPREDFSDRLISIENVIGSTWDDNISGDSQNNIHLGSDGNDSLLGEAGNDTLNGENGNDILSGQSDNDVLKGGNGKDTLYGEDNGQQGKTYDGSHDNDTLEGGNGDDYLDGGVGNDFLSGQPDNDLIKGGNGNDTLYGEDNGQQGQIYDGSHDNDTLEGGNGNDYLGGGVGKDFLRGDAGNDTLSGGPGDDNLSGGSGDDILRSGGLELSDLGNDTIDGGSGNDTLILRGKKDDYTFTELNSSSGKQWRITRQNSVKVVIDVENFEFNNSLSILDSSSGVVGTSGTNSGSSSGTNSGTNSGSNSGSNSGTNSGGNSGTNSGTNSGGNSGANTKVPSSSFGEQLLRKAFRFLFNGPLADATVFIDTNGNLKPDEGELQTITDDNGEYNFDESKIAALDVNGDGKIDSKEGQIVGIGGTDTTTGLPATLPLISQVGSATEATSTTPLTTLQAVLSSQGIAAEQVETLLEKISGLPLASLTQPLDNFDPYAAIGKDDTTGINIASGHIKVMNLLLNGTAFLKAAKYQGSDAEIQVIVALGEVLQKVDTFDLSKGDDLQKLFTQLTEKHNLSIASEAVTAVSELVAQSNHLVDDLVGQALTRSVSDVLPSISPIKKAVYSTLPEVTQQLIEGKITAQASQTKLQELLKADTFLVQYALNEKRTVKVTASPTITEGDSNSQGQFTIALGEAAPAQGLKILYTLSGTATLGQDYSTKGGLFGEINIAPGATEAVIDLSVLDDTLPEKPEAVTLNLKYVGTGYAFDPVYKTAVLQIADNDEQNSTNSQNGTRQTGTFGNDTLTGTEGDDNLSGHEGNDVLQGLAGNDQLTGSAGSDTVVGGEGNDKLEGNFGADILQGNAGDDAIAGGAENDTLEGNEGNDQLQGNAGDDQLKGNTGNDLLEGGLGNDTLEGNEENDWLVGNAGQDILTGGAGVDLLNGGDGADVFYFNAPSDDGDLILDFDPTQGDKIQISAAGFNTQSLADFSFLAGTLQFKGQEIALIQNNGQTYNNFPNLGEIVEIVDAPTGQPAPTAREISAQTSPSLANSDLVKKPQTTILDDVIKRGKIKLGTSDLGAEFDFEFSRTLAAALFGDASKVEKLQTKDEALKMVADGTVDVASQRTTHTLGRDATLNIDFSSLYFYDRQAVMVRKNSGIETVSDLKGRTIGILEGSTSLGNLQNELSPQGVEFISKSFANIEEAMAAYDREEIDAFSIDSSIITERLKNLSNPENHRLLDVEFSKEPIAIILPENDSQWADVVRWVNNVPIQAEEFGISSENIDQFIAANTDNNPNNDSSPAIRRFLGLEGDLGASLGLPKDFAVNVIKQVGNYAEIYDRHFPGVERDRNLLWNEGGLLYSPPFSGTKIDATLIDNDDRNLLADVLQRGTLKLGLPGNNPGFTVKDANGEFVGFDVDLGRAIAAALFGDPTKLEIQVQSFKDSFANTANGVVDVSAMGITQNLVRDASLGVDFSPTYLYTGQGVLVRDNSGISVLPTLNGRRVGILEGATSLQNLQDALSKYGSTFIPVKFATNDQMFAAYDKAEIDAVSTDLTILSARIPTLSNPAQHRILDEVLSKEPLGLITDENQSEWADVVRWVYNTLVQAEEYGITSANIDELITKNTDSNSANDSNSAIRQFLGLEGNIGKALGLPNDFAVKAIKAVGNYGEMYDRHFNSNVLRRDSNALAADFGLQYSPPFSGTTVNNTVTGTEGNDLLNGNGEDNSLNGNKGNDTLYGGQGNDTVWGGKGNDILFGGKGNDILFGGKGSDTLNGNAGDDLLNGGKGNDILFGGKGNDTLNGGAGDDLLNGGKGRDIFVLTPGNGTDAIADFTIGQDLLGLAGGLKFEQLTITQGTGTQAGDTLIRLASTGAVLASLAGSSASSITPAMFTLN